MKETSVVTSHTLFSIKLFFTSIKSLFTTCKPPTKYSNKTSIQDHNLYKTRETKKVWFIISVYYRTHISNTWQMSLGTMCQHNYFTQNYFNRSRQCLIFANTRENIQQTKSIRSRFEVRWHHTKQFWLVGKFNIQFYCFMVSLFGDIEIHKLGVGGMTAGKLS